MTPMTSQWSQKYTKDVKTKGGTSIIQTYMASLLILTVLSSHHRRGTACLLWHSSYPGPSAWPGRRVWGWSRWWGGSGHCSQHCVQSPGSDLSWNSAWSYAPPSQSLSRQNYQGRSHLSSRLQYHPIRKVEDLFCVEPLTGQISPLKKRTAIII